jgi:aryl-alcohol dehydrogenase-like predicted oxidoreductase
LERRLLGSSGISVSRLCFGTLTLGPLQRGMTPEDGGRLLIHALHRGVIFFDTAEIYGTYPHLRILLSESRDVVIATKSYAFDRKTAEESFEKAVRGLGRDYIDIFLLHEQESNHTIRGHWEALEYFLRKKEQGHIGAVGLSTHRVQAVRAALEFPEIAIVHPLINIRGIGIADGTREDMAQAIAAFAQAGRGIYAMKALGGGHLIGERRNAIRYSLGLPGVQSVAIGMQSVEEIDYNVALFEGLEPDEELESALDKTPRRLSVDEWCTGCGKCAEACKAGAIIVETGKAIPDMEKCSLCGYCAAACPEFNIKVL